MNSFQGNIYDLQTSGNISIVSVLIGTETYLKAVVIDTIETAPHLKKDQSIKVLFKETEVVIGLDTNVKISLQNKIKGTLLRIEKGVLLSRLIILTEIGEVISVISTEAVDQLSLKEGSVVTAMVKLNEVILSK